MKDERRSTWKFWAGLAAGVVAGMYLNSDQGRKMRKDTGEQLNRWGQDFSDRARDEFDHLSKRAGEAIENSKDYADKAKNNLKENIGKLSHSAEDFLDKTKEGYEKAANWATSKVNDGKKKK